jgi:nucleotide-binding universal stress UspA family protein
MIANIRHILVALDFNPISEHALEYGINLAEKLSARVTVVHVYSLAVLMALDGEYLPTADSASNKAEEAQRHLDAALAPYASRKVEIHAVLRVGEAGEEICAQAKALGADLIVVGTHGRGAIGRALLGSVAASVLRGAPVPVLTLRDPRAS